MKKCLLFMLILAISFSVVISQEKSSKNDFISDLITASCFAEMYVDLTLPSYDEYEVRSTLIYSLTDEIFYHFRMNDKTYISYVEIVAPLLAKKDYIYHILKAFN